MELFLVETPERLAAAKRMAACCECLSLARNARALRDRCHQLGLVEMEGLCGRLLELSSNRQELDTLPRQAGEVIEALAREFEAVSQLPRTDEVQ